MSGAVDLARLLRRAERVLRGTTIEAAVRFDRTRAIVGAQAHEGEYPELAVAALERLRAGEEPTAGQLAALEGVIRAFRPAPLVQHDLPNALDAETAAAFPEWPAFGEALRPFARSIGRIDFVRQLRPLVEDPIGTGFLVADRLLATNRHVVLQLTRGSGSLSADMAVVRFRYEFGGNDAGNIERTRVLRVVHIHETLDVALLELESYDVAARPPLVLADAPAAEGDPVAVVGYPLADPRNPILSTTVLGGRDKVKRAAPGEVLGGNATTLFHDCSTLGGNSGSPVLALGDAHVVGLHRDGYFLYRNEAVSAAALGAVVAAHRPRPVAVSSATVSSAPTTAMTDSASAPTPEPVRQPVPVPPLVTPRSMRRFGNEASSEDLANPIAEVEPDPAKQAALLAALGDAMRHIEALGGEVGSVMASPQHANASILQSVLAEYAERTGKVVTAESGALEAKFDTHDIAGWLGTFWQIVKRRVTHKHPWIAPPETPDSLPDHARIALLGDWGTGMYGAPVIAATVEKDPARFTHLLHLGDVYYSGTEEEIAGRFLGLWPDVPGAVSRGCNGNHEMYSGGHGYFQRVLPAFRQTSSCFAFQNARWLLVGLDTAYDDHDLAHEQADWLGRLVDAAGDQCRVVLFSHHQPFSSLDKQGPKLVDKLGALLGRGRIHAWYWGHEHHCVIYDAHPLWKMQGRCIGHGGMPEARAGLAGFPVQQQAAGGALWRSVNASPTVPGSIVLDGPNKYMGTDAETFTPHGYAVLDLNGDTLTETVYAPDGTPLWPRP